MNVPEIFGENVFNLKVMQERLPKEAFRSLKKTIDEEEINTLPLFSFGGKITVIEAAPRVAKAVRELRRWPRVGFDTETKPAFQKGVTHDVALLQLSSPEQAYLFRLNKTGLTPELAKEGCVGSDSETWKFYAPRIDR